MEKSFEIIDWDTEFFGFNVAKLDRNILHTENNNDIFKDLDQEKIILAYYSSSEPILMLSHELYDIQYIMKRFPLLKMNIKKTPQHPKISLYENKFVEPELVELGQLAGRQGRFGRDKYITMVQCDEIFKNWVLNSLNKTMATHVLVYRENGKIVGFCTIDIRGTIGFSPLFAVDRNYEGTGVSFALMRAAENIFIDNNCDRAAGGTHELNNKALKVYQRFGLKPQEPEFIYHLWNKEFLKKQHV